MEIITSVEQMHQTAEAFRTAGHVISLVPTMGFFHEGHLELMRVARQHSHKLVISIFVNPIQFGPSEDFDQYPRDEEGDLAKAREVGVDVVFMPPVEEMYPKGFQTQVVVERVTEHLCGRSRPSHFAGVTTVVAKLFNATKPHLAVFGQKDYQQLTVISRMVTDLDMDIRIVGVPTVREPDGLAMSSRNSYLSPEERKSALCLKKSLDLAERLFREGERSAPKIRQAMVDLIQEHPFTEIDYVTLCDSHTLEDVESTGEGCVAALAVRVGKTRLIDNCILRNPTE